MFLGGKGNFFSLSKRMHVLFTFEKHAVGVGDHGWTGGVPHRQLLTDEEFNYHIDRGVIECR